MTFYQLFEIALEKKHMTTAEICAKTGLYPSYFSKLKNGTFKDVTWEKALLIIAALEMTPDEFNSLKK